MKTYARIVNGHAIDVTTTDPTTIFHEDLAHEFIVVPDGTGNGDSYDGSTWTPLPVAGDTRPPAQPPVVTPPQFKILIMSWLGQIYAAAASDIEIETFVKIIDDPRLTEVDLSLVSVQNGLKYALTKIGLTAPQVNDAMSKILSGVLS